MNPAEKYAALRALELGISAAVGAAAVEVAEYRREHRVKGGFETSWGDVGFRKNKAKLQFNTAKLTAWALENMPHEVIPAHTKTVEVPAEIRPSLIKTLDGRLKVDGDLVVDTVTGEVVDFATVVPAKADTLTMTMPEEKKREAIEYVAHRTSEVASVMRPAIEDAA